MTVKPNLEQQIQKLEEQLLQPQTRKSAHDISALLADEFIEIGSSGRVFNKQQTIESLLKESPRQSILENFKILQLASDVILVTYRAVEEKPLKKASISSLRSSIWKLINNNWQMVFHQGTSLHNNSTSY